MNRSTFLIIVLPFVLFAWIVVVSTGTEVSQNRIRVLKHYSPQNGAGILSPRTSGSSGRSLSGSSGWRVSFNNLGNRWKFSSTDNKTDEWTAVQKDPPAVIDDNTNNSFPEYHVKVRHHPKKSLLSKPVVGSIKRIEGDLSVPATLPTFISSTTASRLEKSSSSPEPVRIPTIKNYVEIERRKVGAYNVPIQPPHHHAQVATPIQPPHHQAQVATPVQSPHHQAQVATPIQSPHHQAQVATPIQSPHHRVQVATPIQSPQPQTEMGTPIQSAQYQAQVAAPDAPKYRRIVRHSVDSETGRGFMRRNGEAQQYPHRQHQFQGQGHQPYLPLPQQHDGYIDPYHPVVQNSLNQPPHNPLQHQESYHHHPVSKHDHHPTSLMPLDKTLVYVAMIVTWIFWIVAFTTYYNLWGPHGKIHRYGGPIPPHMNVDDVHGKQDSNDGGSGVQPHVIHARYR